MVITKLYNSLRFRQEVNFSTSRHNISDEAPLTSVLSVKAKNGDRDPKQMTNATRIKEFSLFQMLCPEGSITLGNNKQ